MKQQLLEEQNLVDQIVNRIKLAGFDANRNAIVNLYVMLKSKPIVLLVGPSGGFKSKIVECFAEILTEGNPLRYQIMQGHPWWATQTGDVVQFATMQACFTDQQLLTIIDEALQPENKDAVYLVCLDHISLAELSNIFTNPSVQSKGLIDRLPTISSQQAIPLPSNLLLMGTMDTSDTWQISNELYLHTAIIQWPRIMTKKPIENFDSPSVDWNIDNQGKNFLEFVIRDKQQAWEKIAAIKKQQKIDLQTWQILEELYHEHEYECLNDTVIYLANAWDYQETGLFARNASQNFLIAIDFALMQFVLPRIRFIANDSSRLTERINSLASNSLLSHTSW